MQQTDARNIATAIYRDNAGRFIGKDKFDSNRPTSTITIMTDRFGNLESAFPGLLK